MRINTQFPVAVHILSAIAYFGNGAVPSDFIASSVGTNPVVVRRIMALLKKGGLVDTQSGVKGASLRKEPGDITLLEIYNAVRPGADPLFDMHRNPHPACPVGSHIAEAVAQPLLNAQRAMEQELGTVTLFDVVNTIKNLAQ